MTELNFETAQEDFESWYFKITVPLEDWGVAIALPEYKPFCEGEWSLTCRDDQPHTGYFNGVTRMGYRTPVLCRAGELWMGITAREIESHLPHVAYALGADSVCVVGLGMGYYLYQLVAQGDVKKITVYEKDPDVIRLFKRSVQGIPEWQPVLDKLTIIEQDVLADDWTDNEWYEHVYVDIWPMLSDDTCIADVTHIMDRLTGGYSVSWWSQEMTFCEAIMLGEKRHITTLTGADWRAWAWTHPFNMWLPDSIDIDWYVEAAKIATQRSYNG